MTAITTAAPQAPAAPVHSKTYSDGTVATGSGELPAQSPQQQVLCTLLDTVEAMLGGANGPTIQIRAALLAAPAAPAEDAELLELAQAIVKFNREHGSVLAVHIDNLADLVDERAAQAKEGGAQ